jgi:pimeloyl-ACP methyl ester carboxylesterase
MEGVADGERARAFWANDWRGESFMAIGLRDPVLGKPVMEELRATIRGCPPALEVPEAGHFVQEWGEPVAKAALAAFGMSGGSAA